MITIQDHGSVRELRLSRPPANALNPELIEALRAALEQAPRDGVRALVLSGAPGMYSAGLDVPELLTFDRAGIRGMWHSLYAALRALAASPLPIAAAITGHSPAGGAVLATYCDYRVMADGKYKIGYNEVQVGIPMPVAILRCVARLVGDRQAERLCAGGLLLPVSEALRIGLIDEAVPPEQVVERAVEWGRGMAALPKTAMSRTRDAAREGLVRLMEEGLAGELDQLVENWFHPEAQAALRGLVERLGQKKG
jgi:enoyl-CoA hydratase/carnithine racemase